MDDNIRASFYSKLVRLKGYPMEQQTDGKFVSIPNWFD